MRRLVLLIIVCLASSLIVAALGAVPAAFANAPVWQLTSSETPTNLPPGGEGKIVLVATNLGDAPVSGQPVTIGDQLPADLTAQRIRFHIPQFPDEAAGFLGELLCTTAPVQCVFPSGFLSSLELELRPYQRLILEVDVKVSASPSPGAQNQATVSGGGAPAVSDAAPVSESSTPTPFGIEHFEQRLENEDGSLDTQAGSHPFQFTTTLVLNSALNPEIESIEGAPPALDKDQHFILPPGLIGNPTVVPQCSELQFTSHKSQSLPNECPADTAIGAVNVTIEPQHLHHPVPLFNLTPSEGEPARFGFEAVGVPVILDTAVRTGGDYGVTVNVSNISQEAGFLAAQVTFWGVPGDPRHDQSRGWACLSNEPATLGECKPQAQEHPAPFLTLPTSCPANPASEPLTFRLQTSSWAQPGVFTEAEYRLQDDAGTQFALDGCDRLSFSPSIKVTPDGTAASTPTGLTVDEHVPQESTLVANGLAESDVKGLSVTLPQGVVLNPAAADGLQACSLEQIGLQSAEAPACPDASKVATVQIKTPLLPEPLQGAVYLAQQNENPFGSLVALYIYAEDAKAGVRVKAAGEVIEDPVTGQLTAHFEHDPLFDGEPTTAQFLPQTPFEDVEVHFFGGDRAPLATPALCGSYTTAGSFTPWSGSAPTQSSSQFQIVTGPNGSACQSPLPFAPSLTAGTTSVQAGGFTPFTMTMSREDGNQDLQAISLRMPSGLSGLLSGVVLCGEAQANAGTCGPESEIGETTVSVGLGGDPFSVKGGKVYITGPYRGAPFGLSIVNPAKAGPFDLGKVVVRARIDVDPQTAGLTITSDSTGPYKIPTILDGIPLQIKHVNVTVNRPEFTFNPTNCAPLAVTGSLQSSEGATQALSVPFRVTNCAALKFTPKFAVSTSGKTSKANGASLSVKLTYPKAPFGSQANISRVKVDLPKQLPSRLTTLQKACTAAQFDANPAGCPAASIVGHARAVTPLLPVPLEGPAYFVSHGGEAFPSLIIVLQGYGVTLDLVGSTFISKAGITSSTFKTVPDAPVGSFELNLPQGKFSALAANGNLCKSKLVMPTAFVAQNGAQIHQSTKIRVTGCAKAKKKAKNRVKGRGRHHGGQKGKG